MSKVLLAEYQHQTRYSGMIALSQQVWVVYGEPKQTEEGRIVAHQWQFWLDPVVGLVSKETLDQQHISPRDVRSEIQHDFLLLTLDPEVGVQESIVGFNGVLGYTITAEQDWDEDERNLWIHRSQNYHKVRADLGQEVPRKDRKA